MCVFGKNPYFYQNEIQDFSRILLCMVEVLTVIFSRASVVIWKHYSTTTAFGLCSLKYLCPLCPDPTCYLYIPNGAIPVLASLARCHLAQASGSNGGYQKGHLGILEAVGADAIFGGTGAWVELLLGFSQGARIAANLLLQHQRRLIQHFDSDFKFGVLFAGRGLLVDFCPEPELQSQDTGLFIPTIHVHDYRDPGLPLHRRVLDECCATGATCLLT